ncbi:hypothetical protein LV84_03675 [Algoriphagus ratkowskyi]|uniref:Uncharacterized protein n=1 Tax=Algoriphagus ratkowskyi TaxID=57028 RepID=A0A2W7QSE0_9BACT|nr:hypothetical protein [Algoriphagus ratkowskyi]PZX51518.1 hypothetical protein LV84_03675 [Algoriphagus ratkowskyi]TXD78801.1 hypothetical protein ESW18_04570 [Algoriphagus ratkowskyi]
MIRIRKLHFKKQFIVTLLLTGFVSVFVCDALCDMGLISWVSHPTAIVETVDQHQNEGYGHHSDEILAHKHNGPSEHQENDEEECCDEIVKNLYASLIKYDLKQIPVETPIFHLLYHVFALDFQAEIFHQKILPFLYANLPPPVSGYRIRIFIQSFLI